MEASQNFTYEINEIFYSIQSEGHHSGMPAVFIRFSGCNLACSFCDTDNTKRSTLSLKEIIDAVYFLAGDCKNVILTGGEPTIQNIMPLVDALHIGGYYICLETNGTKSEFHKDVEDYLPIDWVTLSPKDLAPRVHICNEIKMLYGIWEMSLVDKWIDKYVFTRNLFSKNGKPLHYYLQPMCGINEKETIQYVLDNPGWNLSVQWHKKMGIK